ncbi:MAG: hypothetical protein PVI03_04620 [Candidatus Thorarchaeota archaeon]|jgi:hypothetical protein
MNWKFIIVVVIGGVLIMHELMTDGFMNAVFLFGLMLAGYGLGTLAGERWKK